MVYLLQIHHARMKGLVREKLFVMMKAARRDVVAPFPAVQNANVVHETFERTHEQDESTSLCRETASNYELDASASILKYGKNKSEDDGVLSRVYNPQNLTKTVKLPKENILDYLSSEKIGIEKNNSLPMPRAISDSRKHGNSVAVSGYVDSKSGALCTYSQAGVMKLTNEGDAGLLRHLRDLDPAVSSSTLRLVALEKKKALSKGQKQSGSERFSHMESSGQQDQRSASKFPLIQNVKPYRLMNESQWQHSQHERNDNK